MKLLAIETSCDETAAAVMERHEGEPLARTLSAVVASQVDLHEKYGGVYPEIASREHVVKILPVIAEALGAKDIVPGRLPTLDLSSIDAIAVTHGPGLIGSLLVGTQTAATLAALHNKPLLPVNHLAGHIYASFIDREEVEASPQFPLIAMIVSGGHTMLVRMKSHHDYELLGQTRDDAAGEAFDKVAKLIGLPYPGGPEISKLATRGNREAYNFPIGLAHEDALDFSFSGLKTAVLRQAQSEGVLTDKVKADLAASFERVAVDALLLKISKALDAYPVFDFILGGGVAANRHLRDRLAAMLAHRPVPVNLHVPPINLCTDNAEVIGAAALFGDIQPVKPTDLQTFSRLPLTMREIKSTI